MQPVKFVVIYDTKKISYFLPKIEKIPNSSCSNIVYEFTCLGCNSSFISKTERNLAIHTQIHKDSSISKHLSECEHANYILNLNQNFDNLNFECTPMEKYTKCYRMVWQHQGKIGTHSVQVGSRKKLDNLLFICDISLNALFFPFIFSPPANLTFREF